MMKSKVMITPAALARRALSIGLLARWLSGAAGWLAGLRRWEAGCLELARRAVGRLVGPLPRRFPRAPLAGPEHGTKPTAGGALVSVRAVSPFSLEVRMNGRASTLPIDLARLGSAAPRSSESQRSEMQRALALSSGDFDVEIESKRVAVARLWLPSCADAARARHRISAVARDLLQMGMNAVSDHAVPVACIPALDVREAGAGHLEVLLYSDEPSRPSRRVLRALARALARPLRRLGECSEVAVLQLGVVLATRARARCRVELEALSGVFERGAGEGGAAGCSPDSWVDVLLHRFSANGHAPQLAARHNAQVLEAMAASAGALGLDPARLEAGAHSHAARWGSCEPLVRWRRCAGQLWGELLVPVDRASIEQALAASRPSLIALERRHLAEDLLARVVCVGLLASISFVRASFMKSTPATRCASPAAQPPPLHGQGRAPAPSGGRPDSGVYRRVGSDAAGGCAGPPARAGAGARRDP